MYVVFEIAKLGTLYPVILVSETGWKLISAFTDPFAEVSTKGRGSAV